MRRIPFVAALVVILTVTAGAIAFGGGNNDNGTTRLAVVERALTDFVIDTDQSATDSTGDLLTFHNPVFNENNADRVGRDQGECVRIDPAGGTWECRWITWIDGRGSLTVEGPFFDTRDSVLAITGGTGGFRGATGQMRLHARSATVFAFVFQIQH